MISVTVISERSKNESNVNRACFNASTNTLSHLVNISRENVAVGGECTSLLLFLCITERLLNIAEFNNTEDFQHVKNSLYLC